MIQNPKVICRIVEAEAVLVLPEQGEVKVLNEVGSRIWEMVDGILTIREISNLIYQEFEIDITTAEQDTLDFISTILDKGLISTRTQ
jgi:hypothetical protein